MTKIWVKSPQQFSSKTRYPFLLWRITGYSVLTWFATASLTSSLTQAASSTSTLDRPQEVVQQSNPSNFLQQGKDAYQAGQFSQAVTLWQQAVEVYQSRGERLNQVQGLNYLALAYQDLGQVEQARRTIEESLSLLQNEQTLDNRGVLLFAQGLNTKGTIQLYQGKTEAALETWIQAESFYRDSGDSSGTLLSRINQAQALQTLGQYRQAKSLLEKLLTELQGQPDSILKAQSLRSLGVALQTIGDLGTSKAVLEQSWGITQQLNLPTETSVTLFSLGNVARDLQLYPVAWTYYRQAANTTSNPLTKVQAQLNQLSLLVTLERWQTALELLPTIESNLSALPPSRTAIYARVNLAESLVKLSEASSQDIQNVAQILGIAIQQARQIDDLRAEAYALNELGELYKQTQQWQEAETLTRQSLQLAQQIGAVDIVSRSAGQLGKILKQQGRIAEAITAYQIAFDNIQSLRSDLVAINPDVQFDFKEGIEPVYRDFVSLLLTPIPTQKQNKFTSTLISQGQGNVSQENLKKAREVMEALQLAELDNFFRDACLDTQPVVIDEIDGQAAVIYPIILNERLEVILSIPKQPLRHYSTSISSTQVEKQLKQMYSALSPGYSRDKRLQISQEIYRWLIQPAESFLEEGAVKTLIFVPDGFLRNLPMSALYDGEQYLLEKYAVSLSPGLQLFPKGLKREKLSVLAAGLTEARQGFKALPGVAGEVEQITSQLESEVLFNEGFTRNTFETLIDEVSFPVVHLATHGQFSSDPNQTFLLTWNDKIGIKDFDLLFEKRRVGLLEPIELLVMSACQTAAGDNRATLGLAGFALRSGARSTIASLWSVSDEATSDLMREFYRQLSNPDVTKAEALRQAQLKVLENPQHKHPYFWSSFVLIGNWL